MSDVRTDDPGASPELKRPGIRKQLTCGLGIVGLGALMVGGQVGWIWYRVHNAADEVMISKKLLGGGFVVLFAGLLYIVGGHRALSVFDKMDQGLSQIKWYEWLVLITLGCAAVACYHGVLQYLETLGYSKAH